MVERTDLEISRSPTEMQDLLHSFSEDRQAYSDEDIHLRRGVVKDLLEEYAPLCTLAANLPNVRSARLMPQSNEGPDAIVELQCNQVIREFTVQITVANQSHQEALARERLSQGLPTFANTERVRNPTNKEEIQERGRVLMTREARLRGQVEEVVIAVRRKLRKYHPGTEVLLIGSWIWLDDSSITYSWRADLKEQIRALGDVPYRSIYLANGDAEFLTLFRSA